MSKRQVRSIVRIEQYVASLLSSKIPRMKLAKNRQYTVRLMAPFNMRCATCGEYIYKGKKFNARKEDVENEDYLGIRIYRFYIKCTRCLQEISFKTDPKNTDYEIEAGATRNFMALKLAEEQAKREEEEQKEEEANNPMKLLEYRTEQSRQEIELLESLEELKELNRRQKAVDYEGMLKQFQPETAEERKAREEKEDNEFIKSVKFTSSSSKVIAEEILEDVVDDDEPPAKTSRIEILPHTVQVKKKTQSWDRSIGVMSKKPLETLVKIKSNVTQTKVDTEVKINKTETASKTVTEIENSSGVKEKGVTPVATGLSLLADYSGTDSDSQ
ncbi:hypothetical protein K1T71_004960 [Dendrolimus kikuchii]|uniref:Uncharacterized protein n=1 Tax=Dendrolimus kikuchii TaxID=765133 RepID=A0ACC1D6N0_9NEOP|nr:hypothetical protein K1T71_004960 [Dendrolimus kikuchii]